MKKTEIVGFKRANLGRPEAQRLRAEGNVPCVLYGGEEQVAFYAPAYLFRPLVYTPDAYEVTLNIEGKKYQAILQAKQFHPVNDILIHADFLEITPEKVIKISIPVRLTGTAKGQMLGGRVQHKLRKLNVKGPAKDIPEFVEVDITALGLGDSVKVSVIQLEGIEILDALANPVASVNVPRAAKLGGAEDEEEEEDGDGEGTSSEDGGDAAGE
jgi:large subunit ribosomal protein L25